MKHASLFSGIGGFDLAADWMGWKNIFHCEINPFGRKILSYYWPDSISYYDIKTTDFTIHRGKIGVLTGGFPCQPYSTAGQRKGTEDERHLWPEMLRAIREISPTWIVGENVRGIINWSSGLVFDEVQADLEAEGYEVTPFLLPSAGINAQHQRYRTWFIGCLSNAGSIRLSRIDSSKVEYKCSFWRKAQCITQSLYRNNNKFRRNDASGNTRDIDGLPSELDGITIQDWQRESIKGYGNAIMPQMAFQIFKAIEAYERL